VARLRRFALWFGAALVALAAMALLVVNLYVQSHEAQARIQQELSRKLGIPIRIRSLSVTPWGGLTLTGITIPQPGSDAIGDFLQARSFHLHVRYLPLFSRRLIIKEVSLLAPNVIWPQDADGKWRLPASRTNEEPVSESPAAEIKSRETVEARNERAPLPTTPPSAETTEAPAHPNPAAQIAPPLFIPEMRRVNVTSGNFRFLNRSGAPVATFEGVWFQSFVRNNQALRGTVSVAKISLRDRFFLRNLESPLHYDPEQLSLPKISARCANGDLNGQFTLQPQIKDSPFSVTVKFRGVQAEQVVVDAGGPKGVVQGQLEGSLDASGKSAEAGALSGNGEIFLRNGKLQQYSLLVALGQILQIEELTQLQLQQAEAKYHLDPGVATVDELVLRSPNIRVSATGTIAFNGKLRLESQLAINDKVRSQLFSPIRDNFQPLNEPGYSAVDFHIGGSIDRPKTNLMEKVVGRDLKDFVSGLLGGNKPKRKRPKETESEAAPEASPAPTRNPDARTTPP
jgi:uncharacterized protein involved in outer membrane biogenesis